MPMIYAEWNPEVFSLGDMKSLCAELEEDLRGAIKTARPSVNHEYKVVVRGQERPPVALNAPDLEIRVEYHQEWGFTADELDTLASEMKRAIEFKLEEEDLSGENGKIRFYARVGYKGIDLEGD